ncbi:MAG TPA: transglycosylase SLT domain-containing protein [Anaerolineales bacterium]|nr:transglycosylase SLT domain-containing protein [Anaerolineales bacterium]
MTNPTQVFGWSFIVAILLSIFLFIVTAGIDITTTVLQPQVASAITAQQGSPPAGAPSASAPAADAAAPGVCAVSEHFPPKILHWCDWITEYAGQRGLEPDLVAALILQESGGDYLAYSKSGAVGLMQVMPRDGLAAGFMCKNGPCFSDRPTIASLQDPEFNISYGTEFLSSLVSRHGNLRDALKYYGPKDVGYYYADIVLGLYERYRHQ